MIRSFNQPYHKLSWLSTNCPWLSLNITHYIMCTAALIERCSYLATGGSTSEAICPQLLQKDYAWLKTNYWKYQQPCVSAPLYTILNSPLLLSVPRQARRNDLGRRWLHPLLLVTLVQIFWPEKQMVRKIARPLRTVACDSPRGLGGLGARRGRRDHALMHRPVHQE